MTIVELGDSVVDKISCFAGIATAKTEYLFGCIWIEVTGKELSDGKPASEWFDIQRLSVLEEKAIDPETGRRRGGPPKGPPRRSMPRRSRPPIDDNWNGKSHG